MGTTQRIKPGVLGEPNWGNLNKAITNIAKTVENEKKLEDNTTTISAEDLERQIAKLEGKRSFFLKSAINYLVKTGGGKSKITSGESPSIGRSGKKSARKLIGFLTEVGSKSLEQALGDIGFGSLEGKTFQDVLDYLLVFSSDSNEGMDETAANKASCEIMKDLAATAGNDLDNFERLVKQYVVGTGLEDLLCKFWGLYVFEHLSQRFEEKVMQQKGREIGKETFKIIKHDILGQVKILNTHKPINKINWKGSAGEDVMKKIFDSVIEIICYEKY